MAEDKEDSADKPHDPTPKKREDGRKKGDFPKSPDVYTAIAYAGTLLAAVFLGASVMTGIGDIGISLIQAASSPEPGRTGLPEEALGRVVWLLLPVLFFPAVLVLAAAAVQGHLVAVGSKLQPKLSRISILSNAGQKFGPSGLVEFLKSTVKLTIACVVLTVIAMRHMDEILTSMVLAPGIATLLMLDYGREFMIAILLLTIVIAAADYFWQAADWTRRNRMSYKDLKDENKEVEGSPEMKQRRRAKAQEIAMSANAQAVPTADVLVVNPDHYAVALAWDRSQQAAPTCVAKGVDAVALRMKALAAEHDVPIHSDPPTARALYATLEIGEEIHPDHYRSVAAAIRFADALRDRQRTTSRWME